MNITFIYILYYTFFIHYQMERAALRSEPMLVVQFIHVHGPLKIVE